MLHIGVIIPFCHRKLIHHRKETLARRSSSSSSGHKQGLPSSNSEISLSQTPPPPNGLNREYGRQGSMPLSGSMDNMQGEQGFYQVTDLRFHPQVCVMHRAHIKVLWPLAMEESGCFNNLPLIYAAYVCFKFSFLLLNICQGLSVTVFCVEVL